MATETYLNSKDLYNKFCYEFKVYDSNKRSGWNYSNTMEPNAEGMYFSLLKTMLYEIVIKGNCDFLNYLKTTSEKKPSKQTTYYNGLPQSEIIEGQYDCLIILNGLVSLLRGDSESNIKNLLFKDKQSIFRGYGVKPESLTTWQNDFLLSWSELEKIFENLSSKETKGDVSKSENIESPKISVSSAPVKEKSNEAPSLDSEDEKNANIEREQRKETLLETHKKLVMARKENDDVLLRKLQELQVQVQSELKQITDIREDINYNISIEAIEQLISIYNLISEVFVFHSQNKTTSVNYKVLIDNCSEFLESIKQSLLYLGVSQIGEAKTIFDARLHESDGKTQPTRGCVISQVVRLGFEYKCKVVQKAVVTIGR